ncbi:uncharacterized protein METZ01_LOCUS150169 [marine metagenome]|uniref:Uncharacterized protein n=1 Tax=marine metagenome TaxID=408172 RepID=A0A382A703_9ZZZZ
MHPKQPSISGLGNDEFAAIGLGDFLVHKQVLQFGGAGLADGLKTVAGLPVAQGDLLA